LAFWNHDPKNSFQPVQHPQSAFLQDLINLGVGLSVPLLPSC